MDPTKAALSSSAGSTLVTLLTTERWRQVKDAFTSLWSQHQPGRVDSVIRELEATRSDLLIAQANNDQQTVTELNAEWQGRIRRLLAARPAASDDLRTLLDQLNGAAIDHIALIDQGTAFAGNGEARKSINRTWQLSLEVLEGRGLPEAGELLRLLSCWGGDPLPLSLLGASELNPSIPVHRVEPALRGLLDQSLSALISGEVRCLSTHSVLLDSVARSTPVDLRQELAATAARVLLAALPEVAKRGRQQSDISLLAPHVIALLKRTLEWSVGHNVGEATAECALRLVLAVHRTGDYASALTLARDAAELIAGQLGTNNAWVFRIRSRAARALLRLGRFEESEALHRSLMEECEREFGANSPETLENCLLLASPLSNLGRFGEVFPLLQRAVEGRTREFGYTHPLTLIARKHLTGMAFAAEPPQRDEMIAAGLTLMADCSRELGAGHSITFDVGLDYAYNLSVTGHSREALPYARKSVEDFRQCYGPNHPLTLNARKTYSTCLATLGQFSEAIEQAELVVKGRINILGPTHPHTISAKELLDGYQNSTTRNG